MKTIHKNLAVMISTILLILGLIQPSTIFAATTPSLGAASTYGVLGGTYTNTSAATTITGDIGFTTAPFLAPLGVHTNYGVGAPTPTARTDAASALAPGLSSQVCTFTFPDTDIDLATDVSHGPVGVYTPGVYCTRATRAASIGAAGITLNGAGTYIFRIDGALTTVDNSVVTLAPGTSACDVFWTPGAATTLGATTTFAGTIIDNANAITIGANTTWVGRALSLGAGTVTTGNAVTITVPTCNATLRVVKQVVNTGGGVALPSSFTLSVKNASGAVVGGPTAGTGSPGTSYSLTGANYIVSEILNASYTQTFGGSCSSTGSISLAAGDDKTCTVINTYIPPVVVSSGGGGSSAVDNCPSGDYSSSYYDGVCGTSPTIASTGVVLPTPTPAAATVTSTGKIIPIVVYESVPVPAITAQVTAPTKVVAPKLPRTGLAPTEQGTPWNITLLVSIIVLISASLVILQRKHKI